MKKIWHPVRMPEQLQKLKEKSYTPVYCDIDKHGVKGDE